MSNLLMLFDGIHLEGGIPMALFYAVFGFLFVFLGITVLVIIFTILGKVMQKINAKKKTKTVKKAPAPAAEISAQEEEGMTPELVAVISAAVAAYLGESQKCDFVVRRIKRL